MSESNVRELAFATYPLNWKILLEFFSKFKNLLKIRLEGCKILDVQFCDENILVPLQSKSHWMKQFSNDLRRKLYKLEKKNPTVPKWPFSHPAPKEVKGTARTQETETLITKEKDKTKILLVKPKNTDLKSSAAQKISGPKPKKISGPKIKETKQVKDQEVKSATLSKPIANKKGLKISSKENCDSVKSAVSSKFISKKEEPWTSSKENLDSVSNFGLCDIRENIIPISPKRPPKKMVKKIEVALNTTALLRQGATIQQNELKQIRRLQELCNGGNDPHALEVLEAKKRKDELWHEKKAIEAKHLQGLLWQEEATLAKEGVKERNRAIVLKVKAEKNEIKEKKHQLQEKQEIILKSLVEKSQMIKANAQNSVRRNKQNKLKKARKLLNEKLLLREATLKQKEEEQARRAEIVQEIQRLHKSVSKRLKKTIDLTETSGLGLSSEMSIAEVIFSILSTPHNFSSHNYCIRQITLKESLTRIEFKRKY